MPLIILCGIPCSGKTFRASEIAAYFDSRKKKVVIINEESLKLDKNDSYADSKAEKTTRSSILAEVEKNIAGGDVVVIADSLNYIRGFRYELYCRGRSQRTPICLIHCNTNREITKKRNSEGEKQWNTKLYLYLLMYLKCSTLSLVSMNYQIDLSCQMLETDGRDH
jgi:protein KTI12